MQFIPRNRLHLYSAQSLLTTRANQVANFFRDHVMPAMMNAFVMHRIGKIGFAQKPRPEEPGPLGAIIKTRCALVCTSDTHTVAGAIGERHGITLGHEAVGTIYKLGSEVRGYEEGDRVAVNAITPCFKCENCLRGFSSQCHQMLGGWKFANIKDGVFAEFFHVNDAEANLAPIPRSVPDEAAVYTCDMMSTGFSAAERASVPIGGSVSVFGLGPVGLMAVAGARLLGAGLIIGVDTVPKRLELARHFGADVTIDFKREEPVPKIRELTDGQGTDASIEALGSQETFSECIKATRPGGVISNVGYHGEGASISIPRLDWGVGMGDQTIKTSLCPGGKERMKRLLRLIEVGRIDPTPLTSHTFPFQELGHAFDLMRTKQEGMIKPLIMFH